MDWKEFFKPIKLKLTITLVLLVLPLTGSVINRFYVLNYQKIFPGFVYFYVLYIPTLILLGFLPQEDVGRGLTVPTKLSSFIFYVTSIIYAYLISCLTVFVYNKIKSKRKKSEVKRKE